MTLAMIFRGNAWKRVFDIRTTRCFALLPDAPGSDALTTGMAVHVTFDTGRASVFAA